MALSRPVRIYDIKSIYSLDNYRNCFADVRVVSVA